jgi:hypothetical protein
MYAVSSSAVSGDDEGTYDSIVFSDEVLRFINAASPRRAGLRSWLAVR